MITICVIIHLTLLHHHNFNGIEFDTLLLPYVIFFSAYMTLGEENTHNLN